jgi:26S proteasome non-ATPase regulatory subunit 9
MGMPIPEIDKSDITMQQQRTAALRLMDEKDRIEAQIDHQLSILRMNDSTMQSPLVDSEGFPRADIDIVSVRTVNVPLYLRIS